MNLYHISEESNIEVFKPRPIQKNDYGIEGNAVWAIDEAHVVNYVLPRECPRVCYYAGENTSPKDIKKFFHNGNATRIVAVESAWLERILNTKLFLYEMPEENFSLVDKTAGYYISCRNIVPLNVCKIVDIPSYFSSSHASIRILPSLWKLREEVIKSTLEFSIIRMRNAVPPSEGYSSYHPLP